MAATVQVTFDAADPGALAAFWAEVLGYRLEDPPAGFATWDAALDAWGVPPENRMPDAIDVGWVVMADPEGNEFCLD